MKYDGVSIDEAISIVRRLAAKTCPSRVLVDGVMLDCRNSPFQIEASPNGCLVCDAKDFMDTIRKKK